VTKRSQSVTMADVGARAGVTARTVSNVLSSNAPVKPETRERVLRAVDELGYRMNNSARGLRTGRTGTIALAIPNIGIEYFAELARLIMDEAARHDWAVVLQQTGARRRTEIDILSGARREHTDGLIFQPHALGPGDERYLAGNDRLVILGDRIFNGPVDHVVMKNVESARTATEYLIDRGRRRIAAIGASSQEHVVSAASLRLRGYQEALRAAGLEIASERVMVVDEWFMADGAAAMNRLLDQPHPPDAVFCFNDSMAIGALHAIASRGQRAPDDVAVIGFDNIPAAQYTNPSLTTVEPGTAQVAKYAVDALAARVSGSHEPPREIFTAYSLVVRRSA